MQGPWQRLGRIRALSRNALKLVYGMDTTHGMFCSMPGDKARGQHSRDRTAREPFDSSVAGSDFSASARARGDCKGTCLACLAAELQAKDPLSALELALLVDGAAKWNATLKAVFLTHLVGMIRNVAGTKLQQEVTATRTRRSSPSTFRVVSRRSLPLPAGVEQD